MAGGPVGGCAFPPGSRRPSPPAGLGGVRLAGMRYAKPLLVAALAAICVPFIVTGVLEVAPFRLPPAAPFLVLAVVAAALAILKRALAIALGVGIALLLLYILTEMGQGLDRIG